MIKEEFNSKRDLRTENLSADLVVTGGGLSGVCAAITAARKGLKVILIQDRPVLGGNSSSEVRLWVLGATSHLGNNNRWSREGGVIDEILVENTYKNKEGNPLIFDTILLDKVIAEANITLLLNTAVHEVDKSSADLISAVKAFCSQNATAYHVKAPLFCDASGDGIVGFLSGAPFRMGAERMDEFDEKFAPSSEYGELLGHSLYFYSKDTGKPVKFTPPDFALQDITKEIPRFKSFNAKEYGCKLWWLEYGGRMDTVHDTEKIKWELWKVVYGAWNYIKNSGEFPEAETMTLEWVGTIPGKRESRRFEGDYMLHQKDIVEQRTHHDAVAYGGWSIDLHPADGVFSEKPGCNQWHSKGVYQIPYRCLYSRSIKNLFLAGRIISATHVAFASTRVMATAAHVGQAVGMAAFIAKEKGLNPAQLLQENRIASLQKELLKTGHHIPGFELQDEEDLVQSAQLSASSKYSLKALPLDFLKPLDVSTAQMLPLKQGEPLQLSFCTEAQENATLQIELRISSKIENYTPDVILEKQTLNLKKGKNISTVAFNAVNPATSYAFVTIHKNPEVQVYCSEQRLTGVLSVFNLVNKAVSNYGKQTPPADIGVDEFEFWCPQRRPAGHNLAFELAQPINQFGVENIQNGFFRPTTAPNAWVADLKDEQPVLEIEWAETQQIRSIELSFDTDFDHPMETVLMGHPEDVMPFCIRNYKIKDDQGTVVFEQKNNYQSNNTIQLSQPLQTKKLYIEVSHPSANVPAAVFSVRCYK
ncbi:FAD-dependent oxidoreductase [Pedobacter sp. MC2016-14]|uniref:FAD-dependent oxidoreductase n=1 Tax=Pedobacter sp. MC2016-14 TaxID=2897327 RepID=UPI001E537A2F|nr:FAD-dependent oxidoreductase [Pedobacter sp. MC2016-14]MCD0486971.1 FAD-dependent oxidoreductase [Pedobacter sp. MC2016-14]